jgi:hypothetical protein
MAIFVSALAFWIFHKPLEPRVLTSLAKGMTPLLFLYLFLRIADLTARNAWMYVFRYPLQGFTFTLEMLLLTLPLFVVLKTRWSGGDAGRLRRRSRHPGGEPEPAQRRPGSACCRPRTRTTFRRGLRSPSC